MVDSRNAATIDQTFNPVSRLSKSIIWQRQNICGGTTKLSFKFKKKKKVRRKKQN